MRREPTFRILVTGPTGNLLRVLNGGWSYTWLGNDESMFVNYGRTKQTVFSSIRILNPSATYMEGVNFTHEIDIAGVVASARTHDCVVLCIGEDTYTEGPGTIDDLTLSEPQLALARALANSNDSPPVVVVYLGGRPRVITELVQRVHGLVIGFLPGNRGGEAIADVLFGVVNPSARLPVTYPSNVNGFTTYDLAPMEQFDLNKYEYLFSFGHGLSYTTFEYDSLTLSAREVRPGGEITIEVSVKNTGEIDGKETVLVYVTDVVGSIPRPIRQLKKFAKFNIRAGESVRASFVLSTNELTFVNLQNRRVLEPGKFEVHVDKLRAEFSVL